MIRSCVLLLVAASALSAEPRWRLKYFYDEDNSSLAIVDLAFKSPQRGVAAGVVRTLKGKVSGMVLVTADGGANWARVPVDEPPRSIFFLNDSLGWMVTESGIWKTLESGRSWKRVSRLKGALRVHFLDEKRGFAVGVPKQIWQTIDGGAKWTKLDAAAKPESTPDYTAYTTIAFRDAKTGLIAGFSQPPRRTSRVPTWMDPERSTRRQTPQLLIVLETADGGTTWKHQTISAFGRVSKLALPPVGRGLALLEFDENFEVPSEVVRLAAANAKEASAFKQKDRAVRDVAYDSSGRAWLAAVEPPGRMAQLPVPGKLHVLVSEDGKNWKETPVDYRATARRAVLAIAGPDDLWVATDSGMLLKFEETQKK
jgi:photosystem II stability/assembly factor-like uncharacterized protein